MLIRFKQHVSSNFPQLQEGKLGIAISGGVDSVVLAHLCLQLGIDISLLHCNFQLRGHASDGDQAFVKRLSEKWGVPFITTEFNTQAYIEVHKVSTQVAARELRYRWFEKMARLYHVDSIATAHHTDDNLETFLINLSRGTGLEGLTGIPEVNGLFVRPMLSFSKDEVLAYAKKNQLNWREDASNADTKYLRNKLRHNITPLLKEIQPNLLSNFNSTISYLKNSQEVVKTYAQKFKDSFFEEEKKINGFKIAIKNIKEEIHSELVLFDILKEYGFTAWEDIRVLVDAQSGKRILSPLYILLKDRDYLFLYSKQNTSNEDILIESHEEIVTLSEQEELFFNNSITESQLKKNEIALDLDKVSFPLVVRKWKEGDYFYPQGMQGKKKLSKYFKDEKFSIPQKENTWLLCSGGEILWVIGYRSDRRFITSDLSKECITITYKSIT